MMALAELENKPLLSGFIEFSTIESLPINQNNRFIPTIIKKE